MKAAYIECQAGASGDMFLGAWLDLGIDEAEWRSILAALNIEGIDLTIHTVFKQGIRGTKVDVKADGELYPDLKHDAEHEHHAHSHSHEHEHAHTHEHRSHDSEHGHHHDHHHHVHRGLREIEVILDNSSLPNAVRQKSREAFQHLAGAEGYIHGLPPEEVHFHEVGAMDAIVDIVGAMAGWYLAGMPVCYVSPIEVGGGTVHCAHGLMPVPAPATAVLLQGFSTYSSGTWGETVTPTGAAIIKALCSNESRPAMVFKGVGYGAGTKDLPAANLLRIQTGEVMQEGSLQRAAAEHTHSEQGENRGIPPNNGQRESVIVLEANVDDMTPEWIAYTVDRLLTDGALDAWVSQVVMKKGRPGHVFQVLCSPSVRDRMEELLLTETTTLGVRGYEASRRILNREWKTVQTTYGDVRVKIATKDGRVRNIAPEYEDCKAVAEKQAVPLKQIYQSALSAASEQLEFE